MIATLSDSDMVRRAGKIGDFMHDMDAVKTGCTNYGDTNAGHMQGCRLCEHFAMLYLIKEVSIDCLLSQPAS
jgi:hypothetical protein